MRMAGAASWAKGGWMDPGFAPCVGQNANFMKVDGQLPASYMQNMHNLMRQLIRGGSGFAVNPMPAGKKKGRRPWRAFGLEALPRLQAMKTPMKASSKISTAPATGSTMGMSGTMDSTTSWGWSLWLSCSGWDMVSPGYLTNINKILRPAGVLALARDS
jgi:hypothetical protein